jgi:hypothetical protein
LTPFPARVIGFANDSHGQPVPVTCADFCGTCKTNLRPDEAYAIGLATPPVNFCRKCAEKLAAQRIEIPEPKD